MLIKKQDILYISLFLVDHISFMTHNEQFHKNKY